MLESESLKHRTLGFSEVMSGFIHAGPDVGDFEAATKLAQSRCEAARVFLDVKSWDVTQSKYFTEPVICHNFDRNPKVFANTLQYSTMKSTQLS